MELSHVRPLAGPPPPAPAEMLLLEGKPRHGDILRCLSEPTRTGEGSAGPGVAPQRRRAAEQGHLPRQLPGRQASGPPQPGASRSGCHSALTPEPDLTEDRGRRAGDGPRGGEGPCLHAGSDFRRTSDMGPACRSGGSRRPRPVFPEPGHLRRRRPQSREDGGQERARATGQEPCVATGKRPQA